MVQLLELSGVGRIKAEKRKAVYLRDKLIPSIKKSQSQIPRQDCVTTQNRWRRWQWL